MIIKSMEAALTTLEILPSLKEDMVVASGGFDPLHVGHIRYLQAAREIKTGPWYRSRLWVIVNTDEFLINKKSKAFMPLAERMEIINALACVDYVVPWHQEDNSVCGALEALQPKVFAKGGDRTLDNIPEKAVCERLNIKMIFGVGGGKIQSSSWLTDGKQD
jgi:D-beta-D-heptose 7-phosphate kinase/D-beta-D-heptose 1-phosphate adenosyltransferase